MVVPFSLVLFAVGGRNGALVASKQGSDLLEQTFVGTKKSTNMSLVPRHCTRCSATRTFDHLWSNVGTFDHKWSNVLVAKKHCLKGCSTSCELLIAERPKVIDASVLQCFRALLGIGFRIDLWNPLHPHRFLREQFLHLGFLGFPFDHRRERTFEFALIQSRSNDPGFSS
jgi:hypothetical protein